MPGSAEIANHAIAQLDEFERLFASAIVNRARLSGIFQTGAASAELIAAAGRWAESPHLEWSKLVALGADLQAELDAQTSHSSWKLWQPQWDFFSATEGLNAAFVADACRVLRHCLLEAGAEGNRAGLLGDAAPPSKVVALQGVPASKFVGLLGMGDRGDVRANILGVRANSNGKARESLPDDPDSRDLLLALKQGAGGSKSAAQIARETLGDEELAKRVLARLRAAKRRGTVAW
ncbi:hypothetical protein [Botrimarina sp.]|uniref:hypothetical protein n=1 Tax=Botrimarina sp. TaxID=2795802 RepID=UPI0032EDFEC2